MIPYLNRSPVEVLDIESDEIADLVGVATEEYVGALDERGENFILDPTIITETDRYLQATAYLANRGMRPIIEDLAVDTASANVRGLGHQTIRPAFEERYEAARSDLVMASAQRDAKAHSEETEG